jgi:hypothetical protein
MEREKITNEEEALATVRLDGETLEFVPENLRTPELCLEAVKQDGKALYYIHQPLRDEVRRRLKSGE